MATLPNSNQNDSSSTYPAFMQCIFQESQMQLINTLKSIGICLEFVTSSCHILVAQNLLYCSCTVPTRDLSCLLYAIQHTSNPPRKVLHHFNQVRPNFRTGNLVNLEYCSKVTVACSTLECNVSLPLTATSEVNGYSLLLEVTILADTWTTAGS